jgi:peptidoglycan/xylan/chitin deacetylase (PgdA/CDA1 family)
MAQNGVSFGSHTVSHPILTTLDTDELEGELGGSKQTISRELGTGCDTFAFPNGDYDERTLNSLRRMGYRIGCTQDFGLNKPGCDLMRLKRIGVGDVPYYVLALKLSGIVTPVFEMRSRWCTWRRRRNASHNLAGVGLDAATRRAPAERVSEPELAD